MQAIADNANHNSKTLDSKNTIHGMDIIIFVMPNLRSTTVIPRLHDTRISSEEQVKIARFES